MRINLSAAALALLASVERGESSLLRPHRKLGTGWTQLGQTLNHDMKDNLGCSVAMSKDGSVVAMGGPTHSELLQDRGRVQVFKLNKDSSGSSCQWSSYGNAILGEMAEDTIGHALAISCNGKVLAVSGDVSSENFRKGFVEVFELVGGTWKKIGQKLPGESLLDNFGQTLDISCNGDVVAVGANNYTKVFELNDEDEWVQKGETIPSLEGYESGHSHHVRISHDGSILGVAHHHTSSVSEDRTGIQVFQFENENKTWSQMGEEMPLEITDYFVPFVMADSGKRIGVQHGGSMWVYDYVEPNPDPNITYTDDTWKLVQKKKSLAGTATPGELAMSGDGKTLVQTDDSGAVTFKEFDGEWWQVAETVEVCLERGDVDSDGFNEDIGGIGHTVELSENGDVMVLADAHMTKDLGVASIFHVPDADNGYKCSFTKQGPSDKSRCPLLLGDPSYDPADAVEDTGDTAGSLHNKMPATLASMLVVATAVAFVSI